MNAGWPDQPLRQSLSRALRRLIALAHPDRWDDHPMSTALTKELVALRDDILKGAL